MRQPSTPTGNNGNTPRTRTRGAIRTHLGRKRTGPRTRGQRYSSYENVGTHAGRYHEEDLFDRLLGRVQQVFQQASDTTVEALDRALESACEGLVAAGEFTSENAERLRLFLRHDLLQRDNPTLTFRTGDITSAGTLTCTGCGWTIQTTRTSILPSCPQCGNTTFRKTG
jgi:Zn finger protein HypA/HybF involved in hydrogenase expression